MGMNQRSEFLGLNVPPSPAILPVVYQRMRDMGSLFEITQLSQYYYYYYYSYTTAVHHYMYSVSDTSAAVPSPILPKRSSSTSSA